MIKSIFSKKILLKGELCGLLESLVKKVTFVSEFLHLGKFMMNAHYKLFGFVLDFEENIKVFQNVKDNFCPTEGKKANVAKGEKLPDLISKNIPDEELEKFMTYLEIFYNMLKIYLSASNIEALLESEEGEQLFALITLIKRIVNTIGYEFQEVQCDEVETLKTEPSDVVDNFCEYNHPMFVLTKTAEIKE